MLKRPDKVFLVTVRPVFRVFGCAEKQDQESRGLMGFHDYTNCPNCKVVSIGHEVWGSNGHMQMKTDRPDALRHWIKIKAREQWRSTVDGSLWGYRFQVGQPLYYRG